MLSGWVFLYIPVGTFLLPSYNFGKHTELFLQSHAITISPKPYFSQLFPPIFLILSGASQSRQDLPLPTGFNAAARLLRHKAENLRLRSTAFDARRSALPPRSVGIRSDLHA